MSLECCCEVLLPQLHAYTSVVDEFQLWANIDDEKELNYMKAYCSEHPSFTFKPVPDVPLRGPAGTNANLFYGGACDEEAVYLKMNEDIVALDTLDALCALLAFRIDNLGYFLVIANTVNNALTSHLHQKAGVLDTSRGTAGYHFCDPVGCKSGDFAEYVHSQVLDVYNRDLTNFHLPLHHILFSNERAVLDFFVGLVESL